MEAGKQWQWPVSPRASGVISCSMTKNGRPASVAPASSTLADGPSSKHQAPSTKHQAPKKLQISTPNQGPSDVVAIERGALRFGARNFSGAWSLGFEASQPSHSTENSEELSNSENAFRHRRTRTVQRLLASNYCGRPDSMRFARDKRKSRFEAPKSSGRKWMRPSEMAIAS